MSKDLMGSLFDFNTDRITDNAEEYIAYREIMEEPENTPSPARKRREWGIGQYLFLGIIGLYLLAEILS